jgi:hypothetical protein
MINTKKDRKGLYLRLNKIDLTKKLAPLLGKGAGYHARIGDGKFVPNATSMAIGAPWVYVKSYPGIRCDIYHRVLFNVLKIIPSRCRECYKVVVRPRNLVELFDLYELQRESGLPCKCGIELRLTTKNLYGGYFYCKGVDEGRERYAEVRALVDEHLSPETGVILKRYCTEYEVGPDGQGPSDELPELTEEEKAFEEYIIDNFPSVGLGTNHPDHMTAGVMLDWIHHAQRFGDATYKEFIDGDELFKPVVTYHEGGK